ncbi:M35 family metallo-endopeptidase [Chitinophaga sp. GCM10012297]|uniref:Lysine-specific metallo-endopeptidase domain-containing protein n=1 Tax=Chitinophaga chungangae TaxID=2821488 RepID=A0ABS3YIQ0_9BACT|nr:M35 family metallo-endopeptidase [Chitinophaga chungangae]MBO9154519.1 hypothetical protein [Chitinophaga chungangae]
MQQTQTPAAAPAGKSSSFFPQQGKGNFFTPAPPMIQRATADCNDDERLTVDSAVSEAFSMITRAISIMDTVPLPPGVNDALFLSFRDTSGPTRNNVRRRLDIVRNNIRTATYQCVSSGEDGFGRCTSRSGKTRAAYTLHEGEGANTVYVDNIMICFPAFTTKSLAERAGTIIHEVAHYYLGVDDTGYFHDNCVESVRPVAATDEAHEDSGTEGDAPATRLFNADSYSCFVHFLTAMPPADMASRAAGYRGENLSIGAPDGTTIYTQTTFQEDPIFNIEGIPDMEGNQYHASGMRFKWVLHAGGTNFRMMSRNDAAASHLFDRDNTQAFVSNTVRGILEDRGVTSGEVVCTVMLPPQNIAGNTGQVTIERRLPVTIARGMDPFNAPI